MSVFNRFYLTVICTSVALLVTTSPATAQSTGCVSNYNASLDYFPVKAIVDDATYFSIKYFNNYKLLTNKFTNETFALVQCGTPQPTGLANGTKIFNVPVHKVAVLETSDITYLELLGVRSSITELDSFIDVSSPCLQKEVSMGTVTTMSTNLTQAALQQSAVDVVFGSYTADPAHNNSASTSPTEDPGTLNRVEWLKFYAAFFNLEDRAENLTQSIFNNYNALKKAAAAVIPNPVPVVAWATYNLPSQYNNNTPSWSVSIAPYKAQLTADAGGKIFNATTLTYFSSADFLSAITDVDILIDESFIANNITDVYNNYGINSTSATLLKFAANKRIFREDGVQTKAGGFDWFESAVVQEDAVLADLINVVNPNYPSQSFRRVWFRNVATDENATISTGDLCPDVNATRVDIAPACNGSFPAPTTNSSNTGGASSGAAFLNAQTSTVFLVTLSAVVFAAFSL